MELILIAHIGDRLVFGQVTPQFVALLEFEMARTEAYYRHAAIGVRRLKTGRWGVMSGLEVYRLKLAVERVIPVLRRMADNGDEHRCACRE